MALARVFVYGTLKAGGDLHAALRGAPLVGKRCLTGFRLYDTGFGYPAAVEGPGLLYGEVYEVTEEVLATLDAVEGVPDLYRRVDVEGLWVYLWAGTVPEQFRLLAKGTWPGPG